MASDEMSLPRPRDESAGPPVTDDIPLTEAEIDTLFTGVSRAFRDPVNAQNLLRSIRYPRDRIPLFTDAAADWNNVFYALENGIIEAPYLRILAGALTVFRSNRILLPLAERHGVGPTSPTLRTRPTPPVRAFTLVDAPPEQRRHTVVDLPAARRDPDEPGDRRPVTLGNTLHVLRIPHGGQVTYRYHLHLADEDARSFPTDPIDAAHDPVHEVDKRVEQYWRSPAGHSARFVESMRSYGGDLYDVLIPLGLQRVLWERRAELLDNLVIITDEAQLPWEVVHLKPPGRGQRLPRETCFLGQSGLVRWRDSLDRRPPHRLSATRARLVAPEYADELPFREAESRFLVDHLRAQPVPPSYADLLELLRGGSFDLLHYVGHAVTDPAEPGRSQLVLSSRTPTGELHEELLDDITVRQNLIHPPADAPGPIVFLNACDAGRSGRRATGFSGFADVFLGAGAGAFVAPLWPINDRPASAFAIAFYNALRRGEPIATATASARAAARDNGDPTWMAYTVFAHPRAQVTFN